MWDLLSRDIKSIIDTFLVSDVYDKVKREYRNMWLNPHRNKEENIYWDEEFEHFRCLFWAVANWRSQDIVACCLGVSNFKKVSTKRVPLPNYYL